MPEAWLTGGLAIGLAASLVLLLWLWRARRREARRLEQFRSEIVDAAENSTFGERVAVRDAGELGELASTVNRLFDALADRDTDLRRRENAVEELVDTMPEVVLLHTDRVLYANAAAGALLGLEPAQLVGREVA